MLDYVKMILSKVSFDSNLFEKELRKAIAAVVPTELSDLKDWCYKTFGDIYETTLQRCFLGVC